MSYVKIFDSIVASTIWSAPSDHRVVWVTMLAIADRDGYVKASVPGLAHLCRVTREACESALASFLAPDPDSRTKTNDGRRIAAAEGGWLLLNYEFYRDMASAEEKREKDRLRQERKRERDASRFVTDVTVGHDPSPKVASHLISSDLTSAQEKEKKASRKRIAPVSAVEKPDDVSQTTWDDWLRCRAVKHKPLTPTAWAALVREAGKAGWTVSAAVQECAERMWISFKAAWVSNKEAPFQARPGLGYVASNSHIQNTPLGSLMCQCTECVKYREKHGIRGIGDEV